ncbi:hypothetical protein EAG_00774 [Camponotus floridanus]|uniref:Uncharacterized protein n=1 Tax=Camponotus floridanus TaxID=104421 RepID=E2B0N3_CAMFO|nr:hypothetical protein EAG_00774 [Camponotus floridanus]
MTESDNIREREKIAREIEKTSESIRKKHRALKTGKIDDDIAVKTHFKLIIEPLQKIVDNSSFIAVKNEPESSNADAIIKTLLIKRYKKKEKEEEEEDGTPKKRQQLKANRLLTPRTSDESLITSTPLLRDNENLNKLYVEQYVKTLKNQQKESDEKLTAFEKDVRALQTEINKLRHTINTNSETAINL